MSSASEFQDNILVALDGIGSSIDGAFAFTENDPLVLAVESRLDDISEQMSHSRAMPAVLQRDWEQIEEAIAKFNSHKVSMATVVEELSKKGSADVSKLDERVVNRLTDCHFTCSPANCGNDPCYFECVKRIFASEQVWEQHRAEAKDQRVSDNRVALVGACDQMEAKGLALSLSLDPFKYLTSTSAGADLTTQHSRLQSQFLKAYEAWSKALDFVREKVKEFPHYWLSNLPDFTESSHWKNLRELVKDVQDKTGIADLTLASVAREHLILNAKVDITGVKSCVRTWCGSYTRSAKVAASAATYVPESSPGNKKRKQQ